jgi:hypothetical protein
LHGHGRDTTAVTTRGSFVVSCLVVGAQWSQLS